MFDLVLVSDDEDLVVDVDDKPGCVVCLGDLGTGSGFGFGDGVDEEVFDLGKVFGHFDGLEVVFGKWKEKWS